jgi:hypothetical protein
MYGPRGTKAWADTLFLKPMKTRGGVIQTIGKVYGIVYPPCLRNFTVTHRSLLLVSNSLLLYPPYLSFFHIRRGRLKIRIIGSIVLYFLFDLYFTRPQRLNSPFIRLVVLTQRISIPQSPISYCIPPNNAQAFHNNEPRGAHSILLRDGGRLISRRSTLGLRTQQSTSSIDCW